jgi:hypothetical protein
MSKTLLALAAAASIAAATVSSPAQADCRGCGVAAGMLGGLAAGAIIGSAIANNPPPPPPARVYVEPAPARVYAEPAPVEYESACYWTRGEPRWDGFRWVRPRMRVCE